MSNIYVKGHLNTFAQCTHRTEYSTWTTKVAGKLVITTD